MAVPLRQNLRIGSYLLKHRLKRTKYYPFIIEIEPLFACNLSCPGCGKIQYPTEILRKRLSVEDVIKAVEDTGSPMVSIAGGEPLLHPQIAEMVARAHQAQGLRLPLHERRVARTTAREVHTVALLLVGHPHGRTAGTSRPGGQSLRRVRRSGLGDQGRQGQGLSGHHELDVLQHRSAQDRARRPRLLERRHQGRRHDDLARPTPTKRHPIKSTSSASNRLANCSKRPSPTVGARSGVSTTRLSSSTSSRASATSSARPGASRVSRSSAGSDRVTSWPTVTRRVTRSWSRRPTGRRTAVDATNAAKTAWPTAATSRPRSSPRWVHFANPFARCSTTSQRRHVRANLDGIDKIFLDC